MQSVLHLNNLLHYAARTKHPVSLYVRPTGCPSTSQGIPVDDGLYQVTGYVMGDEPRQAYDYTINGWLSPFWRVMEATGWRVASRHKAIQGERRWSLARMDELLLPGLPTRDQLLDYVEKIRPLAGERAERGLEIATSGKVHKLTPLSDGKDRWEVDGTETGCGAYTVSIQGRYCTCPDATSGAAPRWFNAPLCKHRLAVMYITRWQEDQQRAQETAQVNNLPCTPPTPAYPTDYITITPPVRSNEGWRWSQVRHSGAYTRYSQEEYPNQEVVMRVARSIADCKDLPLYLNGFTPSA